MTKYSPEFKAQVVVEYMTDGLSSYTLEKSIRYRPVRFENGYNSTNYKESKASSNIIVKEFSLLNLNGM
ncbi:MAG: hypothetical protein SOY59_09065 [Ligilactobacillus agilis]|nr:hypothetical protein [Ligilactobacillus agilis]